MTTPIDNQLIQMAQLTLLNQKKIQSDEPIKYAILTQENLQLSTIRQYADCGRTFCTQKISTYNKITWVMWGGFVCIMYSFPYSLTQAYLGLTLGLLSQRFQVFQRSASKNAHLWDLVKNLVDLPPPRIDYQNVASQTQATMETTDRKKDYIKDDLAKDLENEINRIKNRVTQCLAILPFIKVVDCDQQIALRVCYLNNQEEKAALCHLAAKYAWYGAARKCITIGLLLLMAKEINRSSVWMLAPFAIGAMAYHLLYAKQHAKKWEDIATSIHSLTPNLLTNFFQQNSSLLFN